MAVSEFQNELNKGKIKYRIFKGGRIFIYSIESYCEIYVVNSYYRILSTSFLVNRIRSIIYLYDADIKKKSDG